MAGVGRLPWVSVTPREIFERYTYAAAITRNPDAIAEMFTEDGVFEAPMVPEGHRLPRRLDGREAIRTGITAFHQGSANVGTVKIEESAYVLHETVEPDVFIAEIDTVLADEGGRRRTISLVQIFRVRDGRIALLRDYFAPSSFAADPGA